MTHTRVSKTSQKQLKTPQQSLSVQTAVPEQE